MLIWNQWNSTKTDGLLLKKKTYRVLTLFGVIPLFISIIEERK